ncbi:glycerate kinase [Flavobacteriaceae bacterium M23B6Z8]
MKFVLAPDKFKNSLTGLDFCKAVQEGIKNAIPEATVIFCPLADGGDGTLQVINYYLNATTINLSVSDPFFKSLKSKYLYNSDRKIAYIEMAEASGLKVLGNREPDCINATSLGTGELIKDAIKRGAKEIILGIGGSATNDAGMGIAVALGYKFLDKEGKHLLPIGLNLGKVANIDNDDLIPGLADVTFQVACDVQNPFYGKDGAAHVYAAQKGATKAEIEALNKGLRHFAKVLENKFNINVQQISGSGAAGGVGGGSICFLGAKMVSGIDLILELANFSEVIKDADFIVTGEGLLDDQTLSGKTIMGVIKHAKELHIPVIALCGSTELSIAQQQQIGITSVFSIQKGVTNLKDAMDNANSNLVYTAFNLASLVKVCKKIPGASPGTLDL